MKLKHQSQRQEYQKTLEFEQVFFLGIDWMDELLKFLLEEVRLQIPGQRGPQSPQFFPLYRDNRIYRVNKAQALFPEIDDTD